MGVGGQESGYPLAGGFGARITTREQAPDGVVTDSCRLDKLLDPRSVAVVGASPNPSFVSGILKNLLRYGFQGQVAAVNPKYEQIHGAPCYPSVLDIPHPVDLVVVGIAHRFIPDLLEQCERAGVGAL